MTKSAIITKAQLYLDDSSELSDSEFEDLFDKIYQKVCDDRPWEFTKRSYAGTTTSAATLALPSNFGYLVANRNHTSSSYTADRPVVFVRSTYDPFEVVSWSDRRQYRNHTNVCWIDIPNSVLEFATAPGTGLAVEYDYHAAMDALANAEEPVFPARFHDVIYHGMVEDDFIIQQSDKAKSYAGENRQQYDEYIRRMAYWNSQLVQI